MAETKKYTAADLVERLRARYNSGAYCVLEQVANGTGRDCHSWIDAVAFSLWPSNGIWRAAFEVKVDRSDWLRELSNPNKNAWAHEHFHEFWYVSPSHVAKEAELPEGTGLLHVSGTGLKVVRAASRKKNVLTDDSLLASFARSLDKERDAFRGRALAAALDNSREHQDAKKWQDGCKAFLQKRGGKTWADSVAAVTEALEDATLDKQLQQDRDHALHVLSVLQSKMLSALGTMAQLATHVITARDETGHHIVRSYGGVDAASLETLKAVRKGRRKSLHHDVDDCEIKAALLNGKAEPVT